MSGGMTKEIGESGSEEMVWRELDGAEIPLGLTISGKVLERQR